METMHFSAYLAMDMVIHVFYESAKNCYENDTNEIREGRFCKNAEKSFSTVLPLQLSLAIMPASKCGFKRPEPDFDAEGMYIGGRPAFPSGWKTGLFQLITKAFIMCTIFWRPMQACVYGGFSAEHLPDMLKIQSETAV